MSMEGPEPTVTQKMADFIIAELRFKAQRQTDNLVVYNGDVVKSDTAVPLAVKESLQEAARILEDVPEYAKDYHPGSGRQVLDLVHQSLFPLVYGRTRILEDRLIGLEDAVSNCCNGITLPPRTEGEGSYGFSYSRVFQWLPCEVDVSGDSAKWGLCTFQGCHTANYSTESRPTSITCILNRTKIFTKSLKKSLTVPFHFGT